MNKVQSPDEPSGSEIAVRESWQRLKESYDAERAIDSDFKSDYRFCYLVDRLVDSEAAGRFTVGEAFAHRWHADPEDAAVPERESPSEGRATSRSNHGARSFLTSRTWPCTFG